MGAKVEFKYINPELYRHPGERSALDKLEKIPGFKRLLDAAADNFTIKAERQAELASMIRVGPGVYPVLGDLWDHTLNLFGLAGVPLHVSYSFPPETALRGGNDNPVVVIGCPLLERLGEGDMRVLLAMQAARIRLGNANLAAAVDGMRWFMDFYGILGAPAALLAWGIENWRRYALFSADRAAALALGDAAPVIEHLGLLAGAGEKAWGGVVRPDALRVQGIEAASLQADKESGRMRRFVLAMNRSNNVALVRRTDLQDWFAGGVPGRILSGEIVDPATARAAAEAGDRDPSVAYWGEFAACDQDGDREASGIDIQQTITDLRDKAEKGLGTFFKAGEAFWNTLIEGENKK